VHVLYFKPIVVLLNVVPLAVFLVLYARFLDRHAPNDWAWFLCLFAAAWGTYLLAFQQTLNNHTIAAACAFFALYPFVRIWDEGARGGSCSPRRGSSPPSAPAMSSPPRSFGILLFATLVVRFPRPTLLGSPGGGGPHRGLPDDAVPRLRQVPARLRGVRDGVVQYEGSFWNAPLEMDWFNDHPEPWPVYLFHMTFGHHGVFSLSPIFLFSATGPSPAPDREGRLRAWPRSRPP
jgi:hypothetical protein